MMEGAAHRDPARVRTMQDPTSTKPLFELHGLRKDYHMGEVVVQALRGVDLAVAEGEFVVILGPSGSGKSTLLNILGGLDAPSDGQVVFRGEDMSGYTESQRTRYRRHNIGFIFQFYNLMPNLTTEENVALAVDIADHPIPPREALDLVQLGPRRDHFPSQLSGGEQQRVAIARAIAKRPDVLLCDEPTGALDVATGKIVLEALVHINKTMGTTLIVITHNADIGKLADRVVRMQDGHVRAVDVNAAPLTVDQIQW